MALKERKRVGTEEEGTVAPPEPRVLIIFNIE